jgi:hypothetical protein
MVPVSVGELFDKISILQIKADRITDITKLENVNIELAYMEAILSKLSIPDIGVTVAELKAINTELWDIENFKRSCEQNRLFDESFVHAARQVYLKNDKRARLKKDINLMCGSVIVEEKSYG